MNLLSGSSRLAPQLCRVLQTLRLPHVRNSRSQIPLTLISHTLAWHWRSVFVCRSNTVGARCGGTISPNHGVNVIYDHGSQVNANVITSHMAHDTLCISISATEMEVAAWCRRMMSAHFLERYVKKCRIRHSIHVTYRMRDKGYAFSRSLGCECLSAWLVDFIEELQINIIELYSLDNLSKEHGTAPSASPEKIQWAKIAPKSATVVQS